MKLEYHRYTLRSRAEARLNARSARSEFSGALIRVDGVGVGCIHPWIELGDASLDDELAALKDGSPLTLGAVALECAALDGQARRDGFSLFKNISPASLPVSHWSAGADDDPDAVAVLGFDTAKLKLDADVPAALESTGRWAACTGMNRLRLDFNSALSGERFLEFWKSLSDAARRKIQFVEDPTPFDLDQWRKLQQLTGAELAIDLRPGQCIGDWDGWLVVKPAVLTRDQQRRWIETHDPEKLVFTSYMDHAIGQTWAIFCAGNFPQVRNAAGLLSHHRFARDDAFFEQIHHHGPRVVAPAGSGLGFDDLLEGLSWTPLN